MMASQKEDLGYKDLVVRSIRTLDGGLDSREYLGVKTRILQAESEIHRINGVMGDFDLSAVKWFLEIRYKKSLTQPTPPTEADPADWFLYIPSGEGYGWQTRALKYADGTLVSTWEEAIRVPTTDDLDDIIDGSAILDGAIEKAKLSSGFLTEHDTVISDLATETFDRIAAVTGVQVQLNVVKPKVSSLEDLTAMVEDLVGDTEARTIDNEYGFLRAYQEIDGEKTRVSRLEVDIDGISAVVAEIEPTMTRVSALEIDIDGITQTVAEIQPEVEKIAQIEIDVGSITSRVAAVEPEAAKVSSIEQNVDTIRASVYTDGYTGSKIAQLQIDVNQISLTVADMIGTYWEAETAYSLGARINVRGESYECTDAGTSGTTEPTWDQDNPVTDGTVEWTYQGTYVADLTQLQINTDHIASIVADGGYWTDDDPPEFVPTLGYTVAKQTKDRFDLFVAGTPGSGDEAAWIVKQDQISSFVTGSDITAVTDPLAGRVTTAEGEIDTISGTTIPGLSGSIQDVADALALTDAEIAGLTDPETGRLHLIETDISTINQTAGAVAIRVDTLYSPDSPPSVRDRDEYLAWLDRAYSGAASQFLINEQGIRMEVQDRRAMGVELNAAIVIEADRITSEVNRATTKEGQIDTAVSQLQLTAEKINLAVWNTTITPEGETTISGQIAVLADSVAARVQGGGSSAFLGLQITLPLEITATTMTAMSNASGSSSAMVLAVYAPGTDGFYRLKPGATIEDFEALRAVLRTAGLLGSRFTVEADEIILAGDATLAGSLTVDGLIKGTAIEADSLLIGWANVQDKQVPRFRGDYASDPSTGNVEGDTYYNTDTKKVRAYKGGVWIDSTPAFTPGGIGAATLDDAKNEAKAAADALLPQIDEKIEAWYQEADPATAWTTDALKLQHDGDQWYNTTSKVWKRYRRTFDPDRGEFIGIWDLLQEADALKGISDAGAAQTTANSKNTIFATLAGAQATGVIGDCFLDGGLLYRATVAGNQISVANSTRLTPKRYADAPDAAARDLYIGMILGDTTFQTDTKQWYVYSGSGWATDGPAVETNGAANTAQINAERTAITNRPQYRGLYTTASTTYLSNKGDWYFTASATPNNRRIFYWDYDYGYQDLAISGLTDPERRKWVTTEYISDVMAHLKINTTHGSPADYGISFIANLAADNAFITSLKAVTALFTDITVTGSARLKSFVIDGLTAGDIIIKSSTTPKSFDSSNYVMKYSLLVGGAGEVRSFFEMSTASNLTVYGRIYRKRNGVSTAVGLERSVSNWGAQSYTETIACETGDYIELWGKVQGGLGAFNGFRLSITEEAPILKLFVQGDVL